ncbi:MAG: MerR family transcriptional regulator [Gorillibacterium sp.]|nr:MerR family transcriptional regulator [Gorillibacterium sp.]
MGYAIKEAAEQVGLTAHTLRYYEQEGLLPSLKRDQHKNRIFDQQDIEWLQFIRCLRDTGMPVAEMKHFAQLTLQGDHTMRDRLQILQGHKRSIEQKMAEMNRFLGKITDKAAWYESLVRQKEMTETVEEV